jgi:ATPase family associated with various cellular activities (AAA)
MPTNSVVLSTDLRFSEWIMYQHALEKYLTIERITSWTSDTFDIQRIIEEGWSVLWHSVENGYSTSVVTIADRTTMAKFYVQGADISLAIVGRDAKEIAGYLAIFKALFPPVPKKKNVLTAHFWYRSDQGAQEYTRALDVPNWATIETNYARPTREALTRLMTTAPANDSGKLILWRGVPGTGKTFALRALAEEWSPWCDFHYIIDPEKFFSDASYMLSTILHSSDKWRVVVLEDAGEMLAKDARTQVGQGLSRLLNVCDGLVGQSLKVMVLISTNEDIGTMHEAVTRPGRCLSSINFEALDVGTANQWLQNHNAGQSVVKRHTLAELYAKLNGVIPAAASALPVGFAAEQEYASAS